MMLLALPDGVLALGAGTALALAAAAVVLAPLLREDVVDEPAMPPRDDARAAESSAVDALREIEFDRETGKLSDVDYAALKSTYTREALAEMRARDAKDVRVGSAPVGAAAVEDDVVERAIRGFRTSARTAVCPLDGPRPEADARFCSACGRFLAGRCPHCGAAADGEGQRFCRDCGGSLAA